MFLLCLLKNILISTGLLSPDTIMPSKKVKGTKEDKKPDQTASTDSNEQEKRQRKRGGG